MQTGKYKVDAYIKEKGLPSSFLYTGNFYENMVLRGHVSYDATSDSFTFKQPIIKADTACTSIYISSILSFRYGVLRLILLYICHISGDVVR